MAKSGSCIVLDFERPERALIERFRGVPVANLDDCMGRMAAMDQGLRPVGGAQLLGPAFTIRVPQGDNLLFHKAMDLAQPGDIMVIDAGGGRNRAILGELMVRYCIRRRLGGIIVDGAVRDCDALSQLDFPIYCRGVSPNGPYKNGPGEIGLPVACGGIVVHPGDILVGDGDGIVAVRPWEAAQLARQVRAVMEQEQAILEQMERDGTYPRPWVDEKLRALGYELPPQP